jgi:multidrug resistance efflux pump
MLAGLAALTVTLLGFFGWGQGEAVRAADASPDREQGVVQSTRGRAVGSPWTGHVAAVEVRPGQAVRKGDRLFRMDPRPLQSALAAAEAVRRGEVQSLAETTRSREADLAELRGAIAELRAAQQVPVFVQDEPGEGWEEAEESFWDPAEDFTDAVEAARWELAQREAAWAPLLQEASRRVAAANREVARLKAQLAAADRRAPIDGVVTEVRMRPGELVAAGVPLVRVDDPVGFRVVTLVDGKIGKRLKPGVRVPLTVDGARGGKLEKIVPGWDRELFHYWVWVKPANPRELLPGEPVTLALGRETRIASR